MAENEPSPRELDVLKALWSLGSGSVREVHERMCPDGELAFNTVQTLLRIMEDKGLIRHRAEGRTFIYEPIYVRDQVTARLLNRVFDGALDQVVLSLLQAKDSTEEELRSLERMIAAARKRKAAETDRKTEGKCEGRVRTRLALAGPRGSRRIDRALPGKPGGVALPPARAACPRRRAHAPGRIRRSLARRLAPCAEVVGGDRAARSTSLDALWGK